MSCKILLAGLRLIRLPNVFTAMADVMAGYFLVLGPAAKIRDLVLLAMVSACVYAGGCALNDVCDFELDRVERPSRPLPSGMISRRSAMLFTGLLFGCGLGFAAMIGLPVLLMAFVLVCLVVGYDCFVKNVVVLGSLTMATCRAVNLLLGMVPGIYAGTALFLPLISLCYVFGLTTLSKFETCATPGRYRLVAGGWLAASLASVVGLVALGLLKAQALLALFGLGLMIGPPLWGWFREAAPQSTGRAVKALVLGIPLLDAAYVVGIQEWTFALPLLGCVVLAVAAAKWMHVS